MPRHAPLAILLPALLLAACGNTGPSGPTRAQGDAGVAAPGPEPDSGAPASAAAGLPQPDWNRPLTGYAELQGGQQLMFLYVAASHLPPDLPKLAESYSSEYRNTNDSFRRNDLLQAIRPQLEQEIARAQAAPYAWMDVGGFNLSPYDFQRKGFAVGEFDHDGNRYFYDNSRYQLSWANRDQMQFMPVADEAKARELETLRAQSQLQAKVYFFAQGADLNRQTVQGVVTRVQVSDRNGRVVFEYGPSH